MRRDGSGLRKLTDNASLTPKAFGASSDPVWAPDGSRILFVQAQVIDDAFGLDLWTIRPDGTAWPPVAGRTEVWEEQPGWGSRTAQVSSCSATARSWGVVTLMFEAGASTTRTLPPARSTSQASSVAVASTSSPTSSARRSA